MESSLRNLVKKGRVFVVSRGRYAARPIDVAEGEKLGVEMIRGVVSELPEQFTTADVERLAPRNVVNPGSMLDYMVSHGEIYRAVKRGGVFRKTAPAVAPMSVRDHVLSIFRREPERVFQTRNLVALTGALVASHCVSNLAREGLLTKVRHGEYQLAPGVEPLPPETILPPPIARMGAEKVSAAENQRVVDFIRANPGAAYNEVCDALGIRASHLSTILQKHLFPAGVVTSRREGLGPYAPNKLFVADLPPGTKGRYVPRASEDD